MSRQPQDIPDATDFPTRVEDLPMYQHVPTSPHPPLNPLRHLDDTSTPPRGFRLPDVSTPHPDRQPSDQLPQRQTADSQRELWSTVATLREKVAELQTSALESRDLDTESREELGRRHILQVVREYTHERIRNGQTPLDQGYEHQLTKALFDAMFRLGRIQPLVEREGVVNIEITGHDQVLLIFADGRHESGPAVADSDADLVAWLSFLASRDPEIEHTFSRANPRLEMRLPGRGRLAAVYWITPRPRVTIRMQHLRNVDLTMLRDVGEIDAVLESFLSAAVRARKTIVVSGQGQGSGKTTFLRALAAALPFKESIATIESEFELYLDEDRERHQRVLPLQSRVGSGEYTTDGRRRGEITPADCVYTALWHNIDRIIVGEVRGPEIVAMFEAMQAGNGSLSTVHADSARDVIERLVGLAVKDSRLSETYAYRQIAQTIDLIVYLNAETNPDGSKTRYVTQVIEVHRGGQDGPIKVSDTFVPGPHGRAVPNTTSSFHDELIAHGFDHQLWNMTTGTWVIA